MSFWDKSFLEQTVEEVASYDHISTNKKNVVKKLIIKFYQDLLTDSDKSLLKLIFSKNPSQSDLNTFLKSWSIDTAGQGKPILLAYFMKDHPYLTFPKSEEPRLQGLLRFSRFKNLDIISHFSKIGRALNNNNIPLILVKGAAFKFLRQDLPREMYDTDLLVSPENFYKALDVAESLGYTYQYERKEYIHSADLYYKGNMNIPACDIHQFIEMGTNKERLLTPFLFKRGIKSKAFGVNAIIPCFEDMLFITLVNLAKNLRKNESRAGIFYAVYDCKFLVENKKDFDWKIIQDNAKLTNTEVQVGFAVLFLKEVASNVIPSTLIDNLLFDKDISKYCTLVMYKRFFLLNLRNKSHEISINKVLHNPMLLGKYLSIKPKYLFFKLIRNSPFLINIFNYFHK